MSDWARDDDIGGWIRCTSRPIGGTAATLELIEYADDDDPRENCALVELHGDLPATPDSLRAAALALLELAE